MAPHTVPDLHQSLTWQLAPGHAMALRARHATTLVVASGCVWATLDGPHAGALNDRGDLILQAGTRLKLAAGQRLVIESLGGHGGQSAHLAWARQPRPYAFLELLAVFGRGVGKTCAWPCKARRWPAARSSSAQKEQGQQPWLDGC